MTFAYAGVISTGSIGEHKKTDHKLTPKIALPVHSHVLVDGVEHIIERRLGERWHLLSFDKDILFLSDEEVVDKMAKGALVVRHGDGRGRAPLSPLVVGEKAAEKNQRKYAYVKACLDLPGGPVRSRLALLPVIRAVAAERSEAAPSFSSVLSWLSLYEAHGDTFGLASLSDRDDAKGRTGSRLPPWADEAIAAGLEAYKTPVIFPRKSGRG